MNVLYAIFEASPFAKTGGLGDVGGALPQFLKEGGVDVRVIMPKHDAIPERFKSKFRKIFNFQMQLAWRQLYCGVEMLKYKGVTFYFIDNEQYFKRDSLYGYDDDPERSAFFCKAVLECLTKLDKFKPNVIHCNDWHTCLIPVMLKEYFGDHPYYYDIKSVVSIHNLKFQGITGRYHLGDLLSMEHHSAARDYLSWEWGEAINFLKGSFYYADAITTVSPSYAEEIKTPFFGENLDGVLRQREDRLFGILNGVDYDEYDPASDKAIYGAYKRGEWEGKALNKAGLQDEMGLPAEPDVPLLALISRLTEQKGVDLLAHVMDELMAEDVQMVVLGNGDWFYEEKFHYFMSRYPDKLSARIGFDEKLAHRIYAGADMFLMPSRFEPCGLSQLIALKYGTVPIVRETGGLKDTVAPYNEFSGEGTGFGFVNYNAHELLFAVKRACALYRASKEAWRVMQLAGMSADFSWKASARRYIKLYEGLYKRPKVTRKEIRL
ncbi:MAG: glycogen synthase GlgA [Clostridiales Family XIII bacterium]|jgi:starch synthase|nr:glycogen synthase GlgA [Clostridiales Family XIII bacterium]